MSAKTIIWMMLFAALSTRVGVAADLEPEHAGQQTFISRVAFSDHHLWLLTDAGEISSLAEAGGPQVAVSTPEPAFDLWIQDGAPTVITGQRSGGPYWTLRRLNRGAWDTVATIATRGDTFIAVGSSKDGATILTSRRIIEIARDQQTVVRLIGTNKLLLGGIATVLVTPESLFVGFNAGEWGGGLRRIARKSGVISMIARVTSRDICGGPLNTECDPVTGIAEEPGKTGCVAVAIGLVHMLSHGRIVEVCGRNVRRICYRSTEKQAGSANGNSEVELNSLESTVPFFGLRAVGDELWAVGTNGIHQIRDDGSATITPLPAFQRVGDVDVSFALPQVVLVLTNVNRRRSLSGSMPLMVVR